MTGVAEGGRTNHAKIIGKKRDEKKIFLVFFRWIKKKKKYQHKKRKKAPPPPPPPPPQEHGIQKIFTKRWRFSQKNRLILGNVLSKIVKIKSLQKTKVLTQRYRDSEAQPLFPPPP